MRVVAVTTDQHYSGILVPDLDAVKKAVYAYSNGVSPASLVTRSQQPAATLMLMDMLPQYGDPFVEKLYREIEKTLSERSSFDRDYDYDGVGRFLKTSVKVDKVPQGYIVGFFAAYVGRKAEADIAEYLGATRGLYWSKVAIKLDAAEGDQFVIDFQPIVAALEDSVFGGLDAKEVARLIAGGYKEDWSSIIQHGGIVPLFEHNSFTGTLQLDHVTVGSYYKQPYRADGSIVTGPLYESRGDKPGFEQPEVAIYLSHSSHGDNGILDPLVQSQMMELTNQLSAHLTPLIEGTKGANA